MFARYYGSWVGRFYSADPLPRRIRDPQSFNKFAYVRNNPMKLIDPNGLNWAPGTPPPTLPSGPFNWGGPRNAPCVMCNEADSGKEGEEGESDPTAEPEQKPPPETGYTPEWRWIPNKEYDPDNPRSRPGKWVPPKGEPGGRGISFDPYPGTHGEPHYDVDDGTGQRTHIAPD